MHWLTLQVVVSVFVQVHLPVCSTVAPEHCAKHWLVYVFPLVAHTSGPAVPHFLHELVVATSAIAACTKVKDG
jgi:hypothetical protein